jgi:predicted GNAT family N-acyltransferase
MDHAFIYQFTDNEEQLRIYYTITQNVYQEVLELEPSPLHNSYRDASHILIVKRNDDIVGGARLVVSSPEHPVQLPMEQDTFILKKKLPEFFLDNKSYGEICRVALLPEARGRTILATILAHLFAKAQCLGCHYLFSIAPKIQIRNNRIAGKQIGMDIQTLPDLGIPYKSEYRHQRNMKLSYGNLETAPDYRHLLLNLPS